MKKKLFFLASCLLFVSVQAYSADEEGKFAGKGAGRKSCSDFSASIEQKNSDRQLYAGWLEGYFTSYNQFQTNNYDISPWQTTELLMVLLQRHCHLNPQVKYLEAVNSLIQAFFPIRLTSENRIVQIKVGESSAYYYEEILIRAKKRLKLLGYYEGDVESSAYTENDIAAFIAYQKKHKLSVTGMPDQKTLASLFLKSLK